MSNKLTDKHAQAELITTVLLILISIAAVVLVSTFVISMIRENLPSTECLKTASQINVNVEDGYTYWNGASVTVVNIERGATQFNLTGFLVSLGNDQSTKTFTITAGLPPADIKMFGDASASITIPGIIGAQTYNITTGPNFAVTKITVVPIVYPGKNCNEGKVQSIVPKKV
jgi:archaellum biogenesis protein FlaJ (TadC family)